MIRYCAVAALLALALALPDPLSVSSQGVPEFRLGFRVLADLIPDVAGEPLENEHYNLINGDSLQATTTGLMVWRKADNWTAFTDGWQSWVNGPFGLQERLNDERFGWEVGTSNPELTYALVPRAESGPPGSGSSAPPQTSTVESIASAIPSGPGAGSPVDTPPTSLTSTPAIPTSLSAPPEPSATLDPTSTASMAPPSATPAPGPTVAIVAEPTATALPAASYTPTAPPAPTATRTATPTRTATSTRTPTATRSPTATGVPSPAPTPGCGDLGVSSPDPAGDWVTSSYRTTKYYTTKEKTSVWDDWSPANRVWFPTEALLLAACPGRTLK